MAIENDDIYEGETTETLHDHLIFQLEMSLMAIRKLLKLLLMVLMILVT